MINRRRIFQVLILILVSASSGLAQRGNYYEGRYYYVAGSGYCDEVWNYFHTYSPVFKIEKKTVVWIENEFYEAFEDEYPNSETKCILDAKGVYVSGPYDSWTAANDKLSDDIKGSKRKEYDVFKINYSYRNPAQKSGYFYVSHSSSKTRQVIITEVFGAQWYPGDYIKGSIEAEFMDALRAYYPKFYGGFNPSVLGPYTWEETQKKRRKEIGERKTKNFEVLHLNFAYYGK